MEDAVIIVALVSTISLFIYMFSGFAFGGGDVDTLDGVESGGLGLLEFVSVQSILLAAVSYSWSWIFWGQHGAIALSHLLLTAVTGTFFVFMFMAAMRLMAKMNSSTTHEGFIPTIGMKGTVYVRIPKSTNDHGIVTLVVPGRGDFQVNAKSDGSREIQVGEGISVSRVNSQAEVTVERLA